MNSNKHFLVCMLLIIFFKNSFAMEEIILGNEVAEANVKLLKPWDEKKVSKGALVAYKSGQRFYYASLYQKENDGDYTIIIKKNGLTTHGRVVPSDYLRIFAQ